MYPSRSVYSLNRPVQEYQTACSVLRLIVFIVNLAVRILRLASASSEERNTDNACTSSSPGGML